MISINIASHKKRKDNLKLTVESLLKNTTAPDHINIYLNDYKRPTWLKELEKENKSFNVVEAPDGDLGAAAKFYFLDKQQEGVYITIDDDLIAHEGYIGYLNDSAYRYPKCVVGLHGTNFLRYPISDWYNQHNEKRIFYCYHGLDKDTIVDCLGTGVMAFRVGLFKGIDVFSKMKEHKRMCDPCFLKICKENKIPSICLVREHGFVREQPDSQSSAIWKGLIGKNNVKQTELVNSFDRSEFRKPRSVYKFDTSKISPASITWGHIKLIASHIHNKSKVVELGSGLSTEYFSVLTENFTSVEHDKKWLQNNSIHRPIKDGWYDLNLSDYMLIQEADVLIVDGPPGQEGLRYNFNLDVIPEKAFIFVDDVHREKDKDLADKINDECAGRIETVEYSGKKMSKITTTCATAKNLRSTHQAK